MMNQQSRTIKIVDLWKGDEKSLHETYQFPFTSFQFNVKSSQATLDESGFIIILNYHYNIQAMKNYLSLDDVMTCLILNSKIFSKYVQRKDHSYNCA